MTSRTGSSPRRGRARQAVAGLWLPATVALLIALTMLVAGAVVLPPDLDAEGGYRTEAVSAPSHASLTIVWGSSSGWPWLVTGTVVTVIGGMATVALVARTLLRRAGSSAPRVAAWGLAGLLLSIGAVLLIVGLLEVPRDASDVMTQTVDFAEGTDLTVPMAGRGLLDAGTALVVLSTAGLLASGLARRRLVRSRPESVAPDAV